MNAMATQTEGLQPASRQPRALPLSLIGLLVIGIGALVAAFMLRGDHNATTALPAVGSGPAAVSEAQLKVLAKHSSLPVYWAGKAGSYELTRTTDGRIYIRYLPAGAKIGNTTGYLTIGTYPDPHAFRSIRRAAARPGGVSAKLANGGLLVFNSHAPKSVYFGYPDARYQVEVFDPSPTQARTLVLSGKVVPIS